ncbi:hypothetical protein JS533_001740 [Bifidobacterium amazonense]|uniref:Uncharacterized protein n=1 Tax=Bifidobacterium amazonense TaxID=2809027 RepID=A0ABS9VSE8_9BIFI|nr:hypothetical protein [Bifidobacterium amazonense]MCH9275011.1 hypothetical protein [Bifidobacterium amazonense]
MTQLMNRTADPYCGKQWAPWQATATATGRYYTYSLADGKTSGTVTLPTGSQVPAGDWVLTVYAEDWKSPKIGLSDGSALPTLSDTTTRWQVVRFRNTTAQNVLIWLGEGQSSVTPKLFGYYTYSDWQYLRNKLGLYHFAGDTMPLT